MCSDLSHLGLVQAVSRWLPIAEVQVRVRAECGVCGGQSGTGSGFLRVLRSRDSAVGIATGYGLDD
jgi:hypothetical protein